MEAGVAQPAGSERVDVGCGERAAVAVEVREAGVVEHHRFEFQREPRAADDVTDAAHDHCAQGFAGIVIRQQQVRGSHTWHSENQLQTGTEHLLFGQCRLCHAVRVLHPRLLQVAQLSPNPNVSIVTNVANGFRYLSFNFNRPALAEKALRKAIACVIDKQFLTQSVLQGAAIPVNTIVPESNAYWYNPNVPLYCEGLDTKGRMEESGMTGWRWVDGGLEANDVIDQDSNLRAVDYWGMDTKSQTRGLEMVEAMKKLAAGDFNVVLPGLGRKDEVGDMASAVENFKLAAIAKAQQEAREREEADHKLAAERKAAMHQLADQFETAVGNIIETVSAASTELEASANSLNHTADGTQHRASIVAAASEEASANVQSVAGAAEELSCLLYTSPSPRDRTRSRMPSSA